MVDLDVAEGIGGNAWLVFLHWGERVGVDEFAVQQRDGFAGLWKECLGGEDRFGPHVEGFEIGLVFCETGFESAEHWVFGVDFFFGGLVVLDREALAFAVSVEEFDGVGACEFYALGALFDIDSGAFVELDQDAVAHVEDEEECPEEEGEEHRGHGGFGDESDEGADAEEEAEERDDDGDREEDAGLEVPRSVPDDEHAQHGEHADLEADEKETGCVFGEEESCTRDWAREHGFDGASGDKFGDDSCGGDDREDGGDPCEPDADAEVREGGEVEQFGFEGI